MNNFKNYINVSVLFWIFIQFEILLFLEFDSYWTVFFWKDHIVQVLCICAFQKYIKQRKISIHLFGFDLLTIKANLQFLKVLFIVHLISFERIQPLQKSCCCSIRMKNTLSKQKNSNVEKFTQ